MEKNKLYKIIELCCLSLALLSATLLVPQIQELLIAFGEHLVGRPLQHESWHIFLTSKSLFLVICFIGSATLLHIGFRKNFSFKQLILIFLVFFGIAETVSFLIQSSMNNDITWGDFDRQRTFCTYALHGINPFLYVGSETQMVENCVLIPEYWSTSPWGLVLGNLFYPGFLSIATGRIYFAFLCILSTAALSFSLYTKTKTMQKEFHIFAALFPLFTALLWLLPHANCARILICFLILACINREKTIFSGILLGIVMIKPQTGLLVCLAFLLQKRFKPIFIAAAIDFISWGIAALLTKTSPLALLKDFLSIKDVGGVKAYNGLFTFLKILTPENSIPLILSMGAGIIFVITFHFLWKTENRELDSAFSFVPTFIATTFWSYRHDYDFALLVVPAIFYVYAFLSSNRKSKSRTYLIFAAFCMFKPTISGFIRPILSLFRFTTDETIRALSFYLPYDLGLIIIAIISVKLNRLKGIAHETTSPRI